MGCKRKGRCGKGREGEVGYGNRREGVRCDGIGREVRERRGGNGRVV